MLIGRQNELQFSIELFKLQRVYGLFDFYSIYNLSNMTASYLSQKNLQENERERCQALIAAILRQALSFDPLRRDILALLVQWSDLSKSNNADNVWIRNLWKVYFREKKTLTARYTDSMPEEIDDQAALYRSLEKASNPLILYRLLLTTWMYGCWDICSKVIERCLLTPFTPFLSTILGWLALSFGKVEEAIKYAQLGIPSFLKSNLLAEISFRDGNKEKAKDWWKDSLSREPLQPWIYYRLWELEQPPPSYDLLRGKRILIFIYTFNKRKELLSTISSLLSSKIGPSEIVVLNNGSTQFSSEEFEADVRSVAKGHPITIIQLPVNIGAPAARNWLWNLPKAQNADFIAYLDDDVILPENWLLFFLQDFEIFPDVVVVGPKVLNPGSIKTVQYVYRFFQRGRGLKIDFTPPAPFPFDLGQYSIRRPCINVMGCCHVFSRRRWERLGLPPFDIAFSPSQVDDIEHDLQIWKHGGSVLYDGRVEVIHLQRSGRNYANSWKTMSHVWGNHMKMEAKFSDHELDSIDQAAKRMDDDFFDMVSTPSQTDLPRRMESSV